MFFEAVVTYTQNNDKDSLMADHYNNRHTCTVSPVGADGVASGPETALLGRQLDKV